MEVTTATINSVYTLPPRNKSQIIADLLKENKITVEEAMTLMAGEKEYIQIPTYPLQPTWPYYPNQPYWFYTTMTANNTNNGSNN